MKVFVVFAFLLASAAAQLAEVPNPYSFNYNSDTEDGGSSSHQETGDGSGHVTGSYTVNNLEGHARVVDYIADENGFRATVRSNEPGTVNHNSADVSVESTAPGASPIFNSAAPQAPRYTYAAEPRYTAPIAPRYTVPIAPRYTAPITTTANRGNTRYVLVPVTDPRAAGYY